MAGSQDSAGVVMVALAANLGIAIAKFTAATWTGSSAMLSEAIHSLADTSNQALLLLGLRRARHPADASHPSGNSRDLYFWSFVVPVLLFSMGASVAIYDGIHKLAAPHPLNAPHVAYIVLASAMALQSLVLAKALGVSRDRLAGPGMIEGLRRSKNPALFTVVLEGIAALTGLALALAGVLASHLLGLHWADGAASIAIGFLLAFVAIFMAIEIRSLIVGEAVIDACKARITTDHRAALTRGETAKPATEQAVCADAPDDHREAAGTRPTPQTAAPAPDATPSPRGASRRNRRKGKRY